MCRRPGCAAVPPVIMPRPMPPRPWAGGRGRGRGRVSPAAGGRCRPAWSTAQPPDVLPDVAAPAACDQLENPALFFMSNYLPLPLTCRRPYLCLIPYPLNNMIKDSFPPKPTPAETWEKLKPGVNVRFTSGRWTRRGFNDVEPFNGEGVITSAPAYGSVYVKVNGYPRAFCYTKDWTCFEIIP